MTILISACMVGIETRWNAVHMNNAALIELVKSGKAVFVCPEQIGGLTTPREPAEIEPGKTAADVLQGEARVLSKTGVDLTPQFVLGAQRTLAFCQLMGIDTAILKAASPSCGSQLAYDGTFSGVRIPGKGITAELLSQNGIKVYNEMNFPAELGC